MDNREITRIYLERVGYRDSVKDKDLITWFWEHHTIMRYPKNFVTKFWLDLLERYGSHLLKDESFELLQYLHDKVSLTQIANRNKWRAKQKETSEAEMAKWKDWQKRFETQKKLKSSLNNLN